MAKFCGKECENTGAICDFCKHFKPYYDEDNMFLGEGLCLVDNQVNEADDGYNCDNFHCYLIEC